MTTAPPRGTVRASTPARPPNSPGSIPLLAVAIPPSATVNMAIHMLHALPNDVEAGYPASSSRSPSGTSYTRVLVSMANPAPFGASATESMSPAPCQRRP